MRRAPADSELVEALGGAVDGRAVAAIARRPHRYATSAPLEEIRVATAGGGEVVMILKDLDRERLLGDARTSKPPLLYEPRREIETYRHIIGPAGIGPRCYASVSGEEQQRHWLLIEKVAGVELWQVGEFEVWEDVARWLGRMHARFDGRVEDLRRANPYLLTHDRPWYESWRERALAAVSASGDARGAALAEALRDYGDVAGVLAGLSPTLIHGEMYPANVLVVRGGEALGVYPVDWEMAAVGPGVIDLAALVAGWEEARAASLAAAYADGLIAAGAGSGDAREIADDVLRARLHLALQWLGWAEGWTPPPEHANDWLGEALTVAGKLGLA